MLCVSQERASCGCTHCVWLLSSLGSRPQGLEQRYAKPKGLQRLKDLLLGPSQKKFASPQSPGMNKRYNPRQSSINIISHYQNFGIYLDGRTLNITFSGKILG